MSDVYFLTHPDVVIDKNVSIHEWDLSEAGREKLQKILDLSWISSIGAVYSSNEQKAKAAGKVIAEKLNLSLKIKQELGEMDRSSTGFLPYDEFTSVVEEFFQNPDKSIRGWERATDAQDRIIKVLEEIQGEVSQDNNILIVSHGGVGALLLAKLEGKSIRNRTDQPEMGSYFIFDRKTKLPKSSWAKM